VIITPSHKIIGITGLVLLLVVSFMPLHWIMADSARTAGAEPQKIAALSDKDFLSLDSVKSAPLFEKLRKPIFDETPQVTPQLQADPFMGWRLSGVLKSPNGKSKGWLQHSNGTVEKLTVGDTIFGWVVISIKGEIIEFEKDNISKYMELS